ncbi:lipoyl(octanoyl) transferase LipB [Leucobacter sp. wl10]|uniref:lipoyl(octanoyl) transferase LipB n=1 Tax=Leucobacter sp. wl10 TaxID=2304677 RepID=UPI000E5A9071|nr:lipoyl(octanoyl) transferase LipB [Leucobacter sp. wl10]RGE23718.1 lipoyl(octanoyl) transferase LipB [Leucobacter sp. wl10]
MTFQTARTAPQPPSSPPTAPPRVEISIAGLDPGFVPYDEGLRLQREAARRARARDPERPSEARGTVLLLEHEPVYTAGRRATPDEYPTDGSPVVAVDRGGRVTWHGPGQLVGYPVVVLRPGVGVVDFVRRLEGVLIDVSSEFGVCGYRVEGRTGVWARGASGDEKYAQIGLHAKDRLMTHGFALNCSNSLEPFARFVPCGIADAGVASLSTLAGTAVTPSDVVPVLLPRLLAALEEVVA